MSKLGFRSQFGTVLVAASFVLFSAAACTGELTGSSKATDRPSGSTGAQGSAGSASDVAGGCDIAAVLSKPANGCTTSNCHGQPFQGGLDLATPGVAARLVGVQSTSDACGGQLLIDPANPDNSLLLRLVDTQRFASTPNQCGVLMPFGSSEGLTGADLKCVQDWVHAVASEPTDAGTPALPFEPLTVESYLPKIKTLLTGGAVTSEELTSVQKDPGALKPLVAAWTKTPEFQAKMFDFFRIALQQRIVGTLNFQLNTLSGPHKAQLTANAEESFLRSAWDIVANGRPFTEVITTQHFAVTTGLLVALAYADNTTQGLRADKQTLYRDPPAGSPAAPWPLGYSVQNKQWLLPNLPAGCPMVAMTGQNVFDMLMGFVTCAQPVGNTNLTTGTVLSDADFVDWHFVDVQTASAKHAAATFYDVDSLRGASMVYLTQPRIGFFTTPAFFGNWDTNDGNQFRVTTSQTLITALGEILSPADPTKPVRLDGLDADHAPTTSSCYGCHQFLDPMRGYFSSKFSIDYQGTTTPTTTIPSFAFHGVSHDGGDISDFAATLAGHPLFASAWVQKLCYFANSEGCDASDPEVQRIAQVFHDSHFDFIALVNELFTSPLVTGVSATQSYSSQDMLVSITRRQHFCQLIDERLGTTNTCLNAGNVVGLIPQDEFSRGAAAPVQPAVTSLFHFAAAEKLCSAIGSKLVVTGGRFDPASSAPAIDDMVSKLMGLSAAHSRTAAIHDALSAHYAAARAAGASTTTALRDTFTVACMSPDVMAIGL